MKLFLSPHNDDSALFGSFTLLREKPLVVTVLRSDLQERRGRGITAAMREQEDRAAFDVLGIDAHQQWPYIDSDPDWYRIEGGFKGMGEPEHVYAPCPYDEGGHEHHDRIGRLALEVFGPERVTLYHTYRNGRGRETSSDRVPILDPDWVRLKLCALTCYESQIREPSTGHHFAESLYEWYA